MDESVRKARQFDKTQVKLSPAFEAQVQAIAKESMKDLGLAHLQNSVSDMGWAGWGVVGAGWRLLLAARVGFVSTPSTPTFVGECKPVQVGFIPTRRLLQETQGEWAQ